MKQKEKAINDSTIVAAHPEPTLRCKGSIKEPQITIVSGSPRMAIHIDSAQMVFSSSYDDSGATFINGMSLMLPVI